MWTWLQVIASPALIVAVLWVGREYIAKRIAAKVQHQFDEKLEAFKADLKAKQTEINVLRSGALSGLVSRQVSRDKRRLEAVDRLWATVISIQPLKGASGWMSVTNFEAAAEETEKNAEAREMFELMAKGYDIDKFPTTEAANQRPFLSPVAWALFSAYAAILFSAVAKLQIIEAGVGPKELIDTKRVDDLLKAALPHRAEYIDQYGNSGGYHQLLDELELALLAELKTLFAGADADKEMVERSEDIRRLAHELETERVKMVEQAEVPASVRSELPPAPE